MRGACLTPVSTSHTENFRWQSIALSKILGMLVPLTSSRDFNCQPETNRKKLLLITILGQILQTLMLNKFAQKVRLQL